jgi:hypothetical protein
VFLIIVDPFVIGSWMLQCNTHASHPTPRVVAHVSLAKQDFLQSRDGFRTRRIGHLRGTLPKKPSADDVGGKAPINSPQVQLLEARQRKKSPLRHRHNICCDLGFGSRRRIRCTNCRFLPN